MMTMSTASLSLDLDNQWSYMKASGLSGWDQFPSYLELLTPRILSLLSKHAVKATIFVVGQDASLNKNQSALEALAREHEIGNHSFWHEPTIARLSMEAARDELFRAGDAIENATGQRAKGFRGPSFSLSNSLLEALLAVGYEYDASTFPTFIGPVARHFYFKSSQLSPEEISERALIFGTIGDGLRPLKPFQWQLSGGNLLELPVTTFPAIRTPFHLTYLSFLAQFSPRTATLYFDSALRACRLAGVEPSLLLHPLDFIGGDELPLLKHFPGMSLSTAQKLELLENVMSGLTRSYDVVPMGEHPGGSRPDQDSCPW